MFFLSDNGGISSVGSTWCLDALGVFQHGMTRHGDCAQIGEVQFLLQDYLTDSWMADTTKASCVGAKQFLFSRS